MKLFSSEQLKEADRISLEKQKITSLELMERAATLAFNEIHTSLQDVDTTIKVFCGVGNNGGDGLVIARLLKKHNYRVKTFVVNYSDKRSEEFLDNYERIKEMDNNWPKLLTAESDFPEISKNDCIIDAIFGIGLNRPLESWVGELLEHINNSKAFIMAIDMPSGLFTDRVPKKEENVIKAAVTLTFQSAKLVFFLPQTATFIGNFRVLDIGLDREYLQNTETEAEWIGKQEVLPFYQPRKKFSHKGTYGHSLIVGGSYGKMGSVLLAANATLRSGAGKVTTWIPKCGYSIVQAGLPEAMVITSDAEEFLELKQLDFEPEVVCFGIGAGKTPQTVTAFENLLKNTTRPMLIDADGLNILSENKHLLDEIPKDSILTPHPKELERLIGVWKDDFDKLEKAKTFSHKYQVILVLKNACTITVAKDKLYVNNSGNPGMATAGSGDVLAGIITGFLSQGYPPVISAVFGVYLHGMAGDFASQKLGFDSVIAGDISENIGRVFLDLFHKTIPDKK